ncbi:hypothetical protein BGX23_005778, partial [Mortierella sp. AD031]
MLPVKRSSPFVRTRSFQDRNAKEGAASDGPPFAKRPFARTNSSPFQVVTPSMKGTKNPFEKLTAAPPSPISNSLSTDYAALHIAEGESDGIQDESMNPNRTLQMFSFSHQASTSVATEDSSSESDDDDAEVDTNHLHDEKPMESLHTTFKHESNQPGPKKPRLHEALEMSLTTTTIPMDWSLKSAIAITSPDSLTWCDQVSPMDEVDALQHFLSSQRSFGHSQTGSELNLDLDLSPRARILSATYHWIYPGNTPSLLQAQNVSKLLKNANNMSSNDKTTITELFSRSAEWKQSFKAIYQSCRNGSCPYFYYVGTSWTVLFQHGSVSLSGDIEAMLTNSTPGLWKVLKDEDINYERLPNLGGKVAVTHFSSKHDLEDMEDQDQNGTSTSRSKTPFQMSEKDLSNTLFFRGQVDVHGLFSYLLNLKTSYEDGFLYQSPSLIAGVPFLHAALKRAQ